MNTHINTQFLSDPIQKINVPTSLKYLTHFLKIGIQSFQKSKSIMSYLVNTIFILSSYISLYPK